MTPEQLDELERLANAANEAKEWVQYFRAVNKLREAVPELIAEVRRLREAGQFMLGWHPTDINHPAFDNTIEYGTALMNLILSDGDFTESDVIDLADKYAAARRRP